MNFDRVLTIDLDNMVQGINDFDAVIDAIQDGVYLGMTELANRMKDKCEQILRNDNLGDSSLIESLKVYVQGDGIIIECGSEHAMYVEYGTGIFNANTTRPEGWWFPAENIDLNKYNMMTKLIDGKLYVFTRGQRPRRFMYETWLWGSRSAHQIVKKNINREIKKCRGVK